MTPLQWVSDHPGPAMTKGGRPMNTDPKSDKAPEVHTEVHPQGAAWPDKNADMDAAKLAAKDKASSADDALDDLFNDLPV